MFVLLEHVGKIPLCIPHARCVRQKLRQMRGWSLRCLFATNVSRQRRNTRHCHGKLCGFPIQNCAMHFARVKGVSIMLKYVPHTMCKAFFNKLDMFPCSKMTLHNVSCRHWLQRDVSCDWHMFSVDRARPTGKFDISVLWNHLRHHYGWTTEHSPPFIADGSATNICHEVKSSTLWKMCVVMRYLFASCKFKPLN